MALAGVSIVKGDARSIPLAPSSVDLVVTSPPYWKKRDYGVDGQIGQEPTPAGYVDAIGECLTDWRRVLHPHGSVFLNVGDSYHRKSLAGIPGLIERMAESDGWRLRNRIVWAKRGGMPDPARDRLANRYEYVLHFARDGYYYDLFGYAEAFGNGSNPGDVWTMELERNMTPHLAPFPSELVRRAITLACPESLCAECLTPRKRIVERGRELDTSRPQGKRAMELAVDLSDEHIAAIQATGISDAGKAMSTQTGTGRNSATVQKLAAEAKAVLGGYFREFTFAKQTTVGWTTCHDGDQRATVLDPFLGTGTTARVAAEMGRDAIGVDLALPVVAEAVA